MKKSNIFKPLTFSKLNLTGDDSTQDNFEIKPDEFGLYNLNSILKNLYDRKKYGKALSDYIKPYNWKIKNKDIIQNELSRNDEYYNEMFVYKESESCKVTLVNNYLAKQYYDWCFNETISWLKKHPVKPIEELEPVIEETLEEKIDKIEKEIKNLMNIYAGFLVEQKLNMMVDKPSEETVEEIVEVPIENNKEEIVNTNKCDEKYYAIGHYWNEINGQNRKLKRDARLRIGRIASNLAEIEGWKIETRYDKWENKYYVYPESKLKEHYKTIYGNVKYEDMEISSY